MWEDLSKPKILLISGRWESTCVYICYLLLYNKFTSSVSGLRSNKHLLSQLVSIGQEIESGLPGWLELRQSSCNLEIKEGRRSISNTSCSCSWHVVASYCQEASVLF